MSKTITFLILAMLRFAPEAYSLTDKDCQCKFGFLQPSLRIGINSAAACNTTCINTCGPLNNKADKADQTCGAPDILTQKYKTATCSGSSYAAITKYETYCGKYKSTKTITKKEDEKPVNKVDDVSRKVIEPGTVVGVDKKTITNPVTPTTVGGTGIKNNGSTPVVPPGPQPPATVSCKETEVLDNGHCLAKKTILPGMVYSQEYVKETCGKPEYKGSKVCENYGEESTAAKLYEAGTIVGKIDANGKVDPKDIPAKVEKKNIADAEVAVVDRDGNVQLKEIKVNAARPLDSKSITDSIKKSNDDYVGNSKENPYKVTPEANGSVNVLNGEDTSIKTLNGQLNTESAVAANLKANKAQIKETINSGGKATVDMVAADGSVETKTINNMKEYRQDLREERKNARADKAEIKQVEKSNKLAANVKDGDVRSIQNIDDAKNKNCGNYGAASCETTQNINAGVMMTQQVGEMTGAMAVSNSGSKAYQDLANKGIAANAADMNTARAAATKTAVKSETTQLTVGVLAMGLQTMRLLDHQKADSKIGATADKSRAALNYAESAAQYQIVDKGNGFIESESSVDLNNNGQKATANGVVSQQVKDYYTSKYNSALSTHLAKCSAEGVRKDCGTYAQALADRDARAAAADFGRNNIAANREAEQLKQKEMVKNQGAAVLNTLAQNYKHTQAMIAAKGALNELNAIPAGGSGFLFNPNNNNNNPQQDGVALPPNVDGGVIANTDPNLNDGGLDPGMQQFNPNGDGNVAEAPKAAFIPGSANQGQNAALGTGSAGGTSAAKEDGAAGAAPGSNKTQAGGSYAAGDGAAPGGYARNGGSAGGIGVDTGFADLLKKFLPGGEEDKNAGANTAARLDDRSPATEKAAVIDRSKNIFNEISKRYQKKNSEGAIVF